MDLENELKEFKIWEHIYSLLGSNEHKKKKLKKHFVEEYWEATPTLEDYTVDNLTIPVGTLTFKLILYCE